MKKEKLKKQTNFNTQKLKNNKAITLIALVVTIVVLLILAGISISLVIGDNGLIQKSKDAKLETRAGTVEDEVTVWKQNNAVNRSIGNGTDDPDTMIQGLIDRGLLNEDEIDREQEIITIKRKNGSIVKQISYSNVDINISKTPEIEKSGGVMLKVTSVEGMTIPNMNVWDEFGNEDYTELLEYINSLNEEQKKELIKKMLPEYVNKTTSESENPSNCKTFEDAVKLIFKDSEMEIPTENLEEEFWKEIEENSDGIDGAFRGCIETLYYNKDSKEIKGYTVTNPDGEESSTYIAKENGTYTFKVKDLVTGKIYTKKVEVTNVNTDDKYYITNIRESDIESGTAKIITKIASANEVKISNKHDIWCIGLRSKDTDNLDTFEEAYIVYNNEKIDISSIIENKESYNYIEGAQIGNLLDLKSSDWSKFKENEQLFIIVKDGVEYKGFAKVGIV